MKRLLPVLALLAPACGGGGAITGPSSTPAPVQVQTLDGWTGQPVIAALSPSSPMPGATVTATAGGYLPRVQLAAAQLFLWPGDEAYVRALVYSEFSPGGLLSKWTQAFSVRPLPGHEDEIAAAVAEGARATGLPLQVGQAGAVEVVVDPGFVSPTAGAAAAAFRQFDGQLITSCRIAFRSDRLVTPPRLVHELGHCLGLGHSARADDVMTPLPSPTRTAYTDAELVLLRMMYAHRTPGNAAPDVEPGARSSGGSHTIVVVD